MSNRNFLDPAISTVKEAIEYDNAANYDQAYNKYCSALELFLLALKWEQNPKSKEMIHAKAKEYMDRAEKLKDHLNNTQKTSASGPVALSSDKSKKDEEEDADSKKLRGALAGAIVSEKPNVKWDDVAGLETAKDTLQEAVVFPIKFPHLFTGSRIPWKGILMYGPPGNGKSYLAKAVATEANSTFFSVSGSDLISKWMGESEKLVRSLFRMASESKPAIIFIDEVDAFCGQRGGEGESEASRRIKSELLVQMDSVGKDTEGVLVLGATNLPWQIDSAIRRRFERKVHITLPSVNARMRMFMLAVGSTPCNLRPQDYRKLALESEGFSGSDIRIAVRDAIMQPIRKIKMATHYKTVIVDGTEKLTPCSPGDPAAIEMSWRDVEGTKLLEPPLLLKDFVEAVHNTHPDVSREDLEKNAEWTREFGKEGA